MEKHPSSAVRKRSRFLRRGVLRGSLVLLIVLLALGLWGWRRFSVAPTQGLAGHAQTLTGHVQTLADIPLSGGVSRFDYQSLDAHTGRLFIAHLGASTISVFDTHSQQMVSDIPGIASVHGVLVIPELGRVYASAADANQVAVIDEHTLHLIATVPGGVYPDGIAYDPAHRHLFVSDEAGQTETVIDTATNQPIATIALGGEAGNSQYDPVSGRIFVDVQTQNQLVAIDPATNQIIARYALPGCQHDHSLLIDGKAHLAFVACDGNNVLLVVDMAHGMQVLSVQEVGETPDVLAFEQDRRLFYVACESGILSVFQEQGQRVQKLEDQFIAVEAHSIAVDQHTHRLYFPLEKLGGRPVLRVALFK